MVKASKISHLQAARLKVPGLYGDGAGLWLNVTDSGSKSWVFRFTFEGREHRMGLGPFPDVSIAEARETAANMRKAVRSGSNPIEAKRERIAANRAAKANAVTFKWCSEQFIDAHKSGWKNAKHADQWTNTLATYANPVIGLLVVDQIDTAHIMKVLEPIWASKAETASRLRGRIESVLDWATVRKFRTGENPARWKGHLDHLLPEKSKLAKVKHHPALPWQEMATFMPALQSQAGTAALALQFTILTAARSGEVRGITWDEVDLPNRMWIVPAERMKAGSEHRVPLSDAALLVLDRAKVANALLNTPLIFPGTTYTKPTGIESPTLKPLSDMSLTAVLRRMEQKTITVHGFRSSFSDWAAEKTDYPRDMAEMALAHGITNKVEAAYRRGDMVEKRRQMMTDWAKHCLTKAGTTDPNKSEGSQTAQQSP
jgi:integrase